MAACNYSFNLSILPSSMTTPSVEVLLLTLSSSKDLATEILRGRPLGLGSPASGQKDLCNVSGYSTSRSAPLLPLLTMNSLVIST